MSILDLIKRLLNIIKYIEYLKKIKQVLISLSSFVNTKYNLCKKLVEKTFLQDLGTSENFKLFKSRYHIFMRVR